MKIPIYNSIFYNSCQNLKTNSLDLKILNNLNLKKVEKNKFPLVRLIKNYRIIHLYMKQFNYN